MLSAKEFVFAAIICFLLESVEAALHLSTTTDVVVGENITLSCTSTTQLVNRTLIWRRNRISQTTRFINRTGCYAEFPDQNSPYIFRCGKTPVKKVSLVIPSSGMTEEQHGSTWTCTVAIGPYSNTVTLNVSVPVSSVNLKTSEGKVAQLAIAAGDVAEFICTIGPSRPAVTENGIQWFRNSQVISMGIESTTITQVGGRFLTIARLNITGVVGYHDSNITCLAENIGHRPAVVSNAVELVVLWKPFSNVTILGYETGSRLSEGSSLVILTCMISGGNPLATLTFSGICSEATTTDRSSPDTKIIEITLRINRIYNNKSCVCTATHPVSWFRNSQSVTFTVLYGPGHIGLSPNTTSYTLKEGKDEFGPITCSADCMPECKYHWTQSGKVVTSGAVIHISNISLSHEGKYQCSATNEYNIHGQMSSSVMVLVEQYEVDEKYGETSTNMTLSLFPAEAIVDQELTFKCSYPTTTNLSFVNVMWKYPTDSEYNPLYSIAYIADKCITISTNVTSRKEEKCTTECKCIAHGMTLSWTEDSLSENWHGRQWICTDEFNVFGNSKSIQLYVTVPTESVTMKPENDIIGTVGKPIEATCTSSPASRPKAVIKWYKQAKGSMYDVTNNSTFNTVADENDHSKYVTESTLHLVADKSDDSIYCLVSTTNVKSDTRMLYIRHDPDGPMSITLNTTGQLTEGMIISLRCELSGGKPLASLSWACKGSAVKSIDISIAGIARQRLIIAVDRSYDGNMCVCTGNHLLWPKERNTSLTFNILYPPLGDMDSIKRSPEKLIYLDRESVTLICRSPSKSKPKVEITWQCNGVDFTSDAVYTNEENRAISELSIITDMSHNNYTCYCNVYYSRTGYNQSAETNFVIIDEVDDTAAVMISSVTIPLLSSGILFAILITFVFIVLIKRRKNSQKTNLLANTTPMLKGSNSQPVTSSTQTRRGGASSDPAKTRNPSYQDLQKRSVVIENQYLKLDAPDSVMADGTFQRSSYAEPIMSDEATGNHYQLIEPANTANLPENQNRSSYLHPIAKQQPEPSHYQDVVVTDTAASPPECANRSSYLHPTAKQQPEPSHYQEVEVTGAAANPLENTNRTSYLEPVVRLQPTENHYQEIRNSDVILMNVVQPSSAEVRTNYETLTQRDVPAAYDTLTTKHRRNYKRSRPQKNKCYQQ